MERCTWNTQEIKEGETVVINKGSITEGLVKVKKLSSNELIATVESDGSIWDVMIFRLTKCQM